MSGEKKNAALDESALEAVTGGNWSAPGYKDYGPQRVNDSADLVAKDAVKDAVEKLLKSQQEDMEQQP